MKIIEKVNDHKYINIKEMSEPEDTVLRIIIEQASVGEEERNLTVGTSVISGLRDIVSDEKCFAYEVIFETYIAYSVINESFTQVDESEVYTGNLFRIYSKSHFLDYVKVATFASEDYPGVFSHYEIAALNHIVEIVSVDSPKINLLRVPLNEDLNLKSKEYEN